MILDLQQGLFGELHFLLMIALFLQALLHELYPLLELLVVAVALRELFLEVEAVGQGSREGFLTLPQFYVADLQFVFEGVYFSALNLEFVSQLFEGSQKSVVLAVLGVFEELGE